MLCWQHFAWTTCHFFGRPLSKPEDPYIVPWGKTFSFGGLAIIFIWVPLHMKVSWMASAIRENEFYNHYTNMVKLLPIMLAMHIHLARRSYSCIQNANEPMPLFEVSQERVACIGSVGRAKRRAAKPSKARQFPSTPSFLAASSHFATRNRSGVGCSGLVVHIRDEQ